jgi:trehalose 6-phosphate phosphatase
MVSPQPPRPDRNWALFLDIDGTLLDIAESPNAVTVPLDLPETLLAASRFLSGALVLVSGRMLDDIDRLMAPLHLPCAAEHGAVLRFSDGSQQAPGAKSAIPVALRNQLRAVVRRWPGVRVEEKQFTVAVHFRSAPTREGEVHALVKAIAQSAGPAFEVLSARMAFEIRHREFCKGSAVRAFMRTPAFDSRIPVFVGDDVTDEDGFDAARALGGMALNVPIVFGNEPANVRRWLGAFAER